MKLRKQRLMLDGVVTVQVKGPHLEEFINRCSAAGIHLWKTERPTPGMLIVNMRARAFRAVRHIARARGWELRVIERYGAAFLFRSLLRRRAFVGGAVLALVTWYALSLFVWFVEVEGTDRVPPDVVRQAAAEAGLTMGSFIRGLDRGRIETNILLAVDELIWAAVEVRGTQAMIRVAERRPLDPGIMPGPGHMIAAWDGVVTRISVLNGTAVVEEGAIVMKGDLLISGLLEPGSDEYRQRVEAGEVPMLHAGGSVWANVWREAIVEVKPSDDVSEAAARQMALELARAQVEEWLDEVEGRPLGEPTLEVVWNEESQAWQGRALIGAELDIAQFLPVDA